MNRNIIIIFILILILVSCNYENIEIDAKSDAESIFNKEYDFIKYKGSEKINEKDIFKKIVSTFNLLLKDQELVEILDIKTIKEKEYIKNLVEAKLTSKLAILTLNYSKKSGKLEGVFIDFKDIDIDSYYRKDILVGNYKLPGEIIYPKEKKKHPVVILIQGSGQTDKNEAIGVNKPFLDIAKGLASRGIASIRYDKRFFFDKSLAKGNFSINDEVIDDISFIISSVKNYKMLDDNKIFLLGHSLGGMIAPKIAIDNKEIKGVISLAGSPRYIRDIIYDQNISFGVSRKEADTLYKKLEKYEDLPGLPGSYIKSLDRINIEHFIEEYDTKMLILQGEKDFQVLENKDFKEFKEIFKNKKADFILYEDLNHLFMKSNGKKTMEEYLVPGNVEEKVIEDISEWINKNL